MKKLFLAVGLIVGVISLSSAQEISKNAIGLRIGGGNGFDAEISYQRAVGGDNNRIELDLGLQDGNHFNAIQLVGIYQWVWNIEGGFNWYAGPGVGVGFYSFDDDHFPGNDHPSETYALITGDIGIEYNFDFPLQLSLDFRPAFVLDDYDDGDDVDFGIGLGVRYKF